MLKSYIKVMRNYATFSGRATRREYWSFAAVNLIVAFAGIFLVAIPYWTIGPDAMLTVWVGMAYLIAFILYELGTVIPWLAVSVRRLHDINKSAWWLLLLLGMALLPFITLLPLLFMSAQPTYPHPNKYGNPEVN